MLMQQHFGLQFKLLLEDCCNGIWKITKEKEQEIFGDTDEFGSAFEDQGKASLHVHMMVWIGALQKVPEHLFNTEGSVNDEMFSYELCESNHEFII